jgi:carboxyl-terminal processing protease
MLVDKGVILRTKGRKPVFDNEFQADPKIELDTSIPIVLMVNGDSASASEIMAGCLQDLCRAQIAGSRSYGKGTVQQVFELERDTSALKFTTARFLSPNGKNIHRSEEMTESDEWGIKPEQNLNVPMSDLQEIYLMRRWFSRGDPRSLLRGERPPEPPFAADPQLDAAVQYLRKKIESTDSGEKTESHTSSESSSASSEVDSSTLNQKLDEATR